MNTNRMNILDLAIDERDLEIREDELVSITNEAFAGWPRRPA